MKHLTDEELAVVARSPRTRGLGLDAINEMAHRLKSRPKVEAVDLTTCEVLLAEIATLANELPEKRPAMLHYFLHSHGIVALQGRERKDAILQGLDEAARLASIKLRDRAPKREGR